MRITLEITAGPEAGRKLWLAERQSIVVGRTQLAEFSIPDDALLSSVHFQVGWNEAGFRLRDLKSTNGTQLNGQRAEEAALQTGDVILAGNTRFAVFIESDAVAPMDLPAPSRVDETLVLGTPDRVPAKSDPTVAEDVEPAPLLVIDNHTRFSVACLPWQNADGAGRLTVIIKATFCFADSELAVAEHQLPISFADQHDEDDPLQPVRLEADTAPFKPRADVVLVGKAYAPGGRPRTSVDVRLRVGGLNKRLRVFGDRKWLFPTRLVLVPQITDPVPFAEMPLTYARAFGGIDESAARYCAENLCGVGFIGEPSPASIHNKPLPNIEDPDHLIGAWDSRPAPVGFGFYGRGWQPRLKYAGTYDEAYRRNRSPRLPEDFSYEIHNGAHPKLQVAGYLDGDELVELENLTRDGHVKFNLTGVRPQITLTRYVAPRETKTERPVKPFLDTLVFVPDKRLVYEIFRAVFAVRNIDELDVAGIRIE